MTSKEDIKRQIASLQSKLAEAPDTPPAKRRRPDQGGVLAPATPSPKKKSAARQNSPSLVDRTGRQPQTRRPSNSGTGQNARHGQSNPATVSDSSSFLSHLVALSANDDHAHKSLTRTEGFEERPVAPSMSESGTTPVRDDRLAIVEDLVPGPVGHRPIADDPEFERVEPNSGIRLKSRILSHTSLQDHLSGRYYLPPSLLYSVVRLQPNKQAYEVPVEGDWVTIAVVAERGDVKFASGPGNSANLNRRDEENDDVFGENDKQGNNKKRKKTKEEEDEDNPRKGGKKYVHLKLVDLGHRSRSYNSTTDSSRGSLRGDAQLSLLLFESDYHDKLIDKGGKKGKVKKLWRGGSGGAFEECFPGLREGTVIALLNPKVLKPFTNNKNPSPSSSILALTPPSSSAVAVVGIAADLGRCTVLKRDGKPCGSWVDRRISPGGPTSRPSEDVCEYHIQTAVQRTRAARPEFSVGTSGMSTTAHKRKSAYNPAQQQGLKPETGTRGQDGEATYVVGGLVASSGRAPILGNVSSTMGREEQARARRKAGAGEDKVLAELLGKGGSRISGSSGSEASRGALVVVQKAREAVIQAKVRNKLNPKATNKGKEIATLVREDSNRSEPRRKAYSAEIIKRIGFDPTAKGYAGNNDAKRRNADALSKVGKLGSQNREFQLGPPPGPKIRSGVVVSHLRSSQASMIESAPTGERECDAPTTPPKVSGSNRRPSSMDGKDRPRGICAPLRPHDGAEDDSGSDLEIEPPSARLTTEMTPDVELGLQCV